MKNQADVDRIAEEAVGQIHDSPPPYVLREQQHKSPDEMALAISAGAQASISEKTAESVGERAGDAYSDAGSVTQTQKSNPALQRVTWARDRARPFMMTVAAFALGYITALLVHGHINVNFGTAPGPFQITKPPHDDSHPRGFVQSTVLKTITEHPQGMTTAEIMEELCSQGIGRQSIEYALSALIRAKKVSSLDGASKYISAAAEVPTAPDQPSA